MVVFGLIAVLLPGLDAGGQWRLGDRLFFAGVGLSIAALLWRYATIRAIPTRESLTIRNLFTTRTVPWLSVVDLRFGGGDPWVTIELDDTDTVAVMACRRPTVPTAVPKPADWRRSSRRSARQRPVPTSSLRSGVAEPHGTWRNPGRAPHQGELHEHDQRQRHPHAGEASGRVPQGTHGRGPIDANE